MSALRKVLVVDDDPVVGKSFHRVLSQDKGYVVITAQNAAEALERLREQEYDLVYTDIKMPGMNGLELAEKVKARQPWTPVVIVTGYGSRAHEQRAREAGVSAFVRKPLTPEMIEDSANFALCQPTTIVQAAPSALLPATHHDTPLVQSVAPHEPGAMRIALLIASPLIGLVYAVGLPFVGLALLLSLGTKALLKTEAARNTPRFLKNVVLFLAAPFIGLAYALSMPLVGVGMIAWTAWQALQKKPVAARRLHQAGKILALAGVPLIGLAYAVLLPLWGTAMLLWTGLQAVRERRLA